MSSGSEWSNNNVSPPSDISLPYQFDPTVSDSPSSTDPGHLIVQLDLENELIDSPTTSPVISRFQQIARRLRGENRALREEVDFAYHDMGNAEKAHVAVCDHVSELATSNIQLSLRLEEARLEATQYSNIMRQLKIYSCVISVMFVACLVHKFLF